MSEIIRNHLQEIKRGLRYGVIYVVASPNRNDNHVNQISSNLIEELRSLTGYEIQMVDSPEAEGVTLMARRINVGNAGKDAVVQMPLNSFGDVHRFIESATDVLSTEEGDQWLGPLLRSIEYSAGFLKEQGFDDEILSLSHPEFTSRKKKSIIRIIRDKFSDVQAAVCHEDSCRDYEEKGREARQAGPLMPAPDVLDDEEKELLSIERQREVALQTIQAQIVDYVTKYHADPSQLITTLLEGKIVVGDKRQPSRLVVNKDLKIVLPNYNEVEVKMPAMCRAIYILFLKHHNGIALRDIADHRADLENIYSMVMPGRSENKAKAAIDNLLDPMGNTLNEYISKIKRCFKLCIIDKNLVNQYCITGKRGEPYRIALDQSLITLPRAVTN